MKVTVTFCDPCPRVIAKAMIASVRKRLNCPIVQLTDDKTEKLDGVDEVIRRTPLGDFGEFRLGHFMQMDGPVLHLDYDVILNRDVSEVFDMDFDVVLTRRPDNDPTAAKAIQKASPHNMGVVFSKNDDFWAETYIHYLTLPSTWMGIQIATTEMAHFLKNRMKIIELPGEVYNYTPRSVDEDVSQKAIVHYKGNRKHWMVPEFEAEEAKLGGEMVVDMASRTNRKIYITEKHPLAQ